MAEGCGRGVFARGEGQHLVYTEQLYFAQLYFANFGPSLCCACPRGGSLHARDTSQASKDTFWWVVFNGQHDGQWFRGQVKLFNVLCAMFNVSFSGSVSRVQYSCARCNVQISGIQNKP